jgi:hypothetical protein
MLQRIQSVWLLLASICGFLMNNFDLFSGTKQDGSVVNYGVSGSLMLKAILLATAIYALVCIFLFKNRKLQIKLTLLGVGLSVACLVIEYLGVNALKTASNFKDANYTIWAILPIAMIVFFLMAARGILADEKMVKDADRLR